MVKTFLQTDQEPRPAQDDFKLDNLLSDVAQNYDKIKSEFLNLNDKFIREQLRALRALKIAKIAVEYNNIDRGILNEYNSNQSKGKGSKKSSNPWFEYMGEENKQINDLLQDSVNKSQDENKKLIKLLIESQNNEQETSTKLQQTENDLNNAKERISALEFKLKNMSKYQILYKEACEEIKTNQDNAELKFG